MVPTPRTATQDRILDVAEAVFAQKGFRGGALNDVAVAAGYTRAGLLHHYPSKEALLLAILERRDENLRALESIGPDDSIFDVLDMLPDVTRQLLDLRILIELGHIVTAEASSPDHPAHEWCVTRERKLRESAAGAVERAKRLGELREDVDSRALGLLVLAAFEGLESQWLLDENVDFLGGIEMLRRLVESLRP